MMLRDFAEFEFDLPADTYADVIGAVENLGENFRTVLFVWRREGGVIRLVPVLSVVRPKSSLLSKDGPIARLLQRQSDLRAVRTEEETRLHS